MSVIVDLLGTTITPEEDAILTHDKATGVILFTRNIQDRNQLAKLLHDIHAINPNLITCVDHEGGYVQRIQRLGFRALPPARLYGDTYDLDAKTGLELSKRYGSIMAKDLLQFGIHMSFAPVLDIHGDNAIIAGLDRAFHEDPTIIAKLASAYIEGMHKAGMPSVGKHFPGHGYCSDDSHISMPKDTRSFDDINAHDLEPFKALIASGQLDAIMPAHITYPEVDGDNPAGFSTTWLQSILRDKLGFRGLIISDCLGMKGADIGDLNTRALKALSAGCNMLIAANQERPVLKAVLDAVPDDIHTHNMPYIEAFRAKIEVSKPQLEASESPQKETNSKQNPTDTI